MIRHLYVHIPFCARICPYCAFYKDLLDRSQTWRFCEAVSRDLDQQRTHFAISPETIYFGGGTPTALTTAQLEFLLEGFRRRFDLSSVEEWTIESNPGSVSARKAALQELQRYIVDQAYISSMVGFISAGANWPWLKNLRRAGQPASTLWLRFEGTSVTNGSATAAVYAADRACAFSPRAARRSRSRARRLTRCRGC